MSNDPVHGQGYRRLPPWAWTLAAIIWPVGVFVALAAARVMRWWQSLLAVVAVCLLCAGVSHFGAIAARPSGPTWAPAVFFAAVGLLLFGVTELQYRIGKRRGYWSHQALRVWDIVAVPAVSLLLLSLLILLPLLAAWAWSGLSDWLAGLHPGHGVPTSDD